MTSRETRATRQGQLSLLFITFSIVVSSAAALTPVETKGIKTHRPFCSRSTMSDHPSTTGLVMAAGGADDPLASSTAAASNTMRANAAFLIPSQIVNSSSKFKSKRQHQQHRSRRQPNASSAAVSTTAIFNSHSDNSAHDDEDVIVYQGVNKNIQKKHQDKQNEIDQVTEMLQEAMMDTSSAKTAQSKKMKNGQLQKEPSTSATQRMGQQQQQRNRVKLPKTGNLPDIQWRAIPMEHLRTHPSFQPLPDPSTIKHLNDLEDVQFFRQDSWQWDALHDGRCTTSQACAALGLLEQRAGHELGIPRSLRRGGMGAYHRLRGDALRSLEEMNEVLCNGGASANAGYSSGNGIEEEKKEDSSVWERSRTNWNKIRVQNNNNPTAQRKRKTQRKPFPFAAKYLPVIEKKDLEHRKKEAQNHYFSHWSTTPMIARMQWGNTQEATAILTALNYFWKIDSDIVVKEVGMCGAGLKMNTTAEDSGKDGLIVGASPDAIIQYPNGTLEALEVKNHCPFVPKDWGARSRRNKRKNGNATTDDSYRSDKVFRIRELPIRPTVPPMYVPQLMMEMLCLGPSCRSVVMVRQTATIGAVILRLHRDDKWIEEMLYWLRRFMADFVQKGTPPPANFFWDNTDGLYGGGERYRKFVMRTKELGEAVELVDFVSHNSVQRVMSAKKEPMSLFLD